MIILKTASGRIVFRGRHLALALRIAHLYQSNGVLLFMQTSAFQEGIFYEKD
jgi:hypothetical protein